MRRPALIAAALIALTTAGCSYDVRLNAAPFRFNANVDADVRLRLDQEVTSLIASHPNLF